MVHHRSARPEMEAAWRRKAAYADKDTSIFLMISEEYDVKKVQQWIFSPVTEVRYHEAAIDTEQTRGNDKAKADARTPRPTKIERTPKPTILPRLHTIMGRFKEMLRILQNKNPKPSTPGVSPGRTPNASRPSSAIYGMPPKSTVIVPLYMYPLDESTWEPLHKS
jgi:hypothetical protein